MVANFRIDIKNQLGVRVASLTDWRRLSFTRRVNGIDSYELEIDGDLTDIVGLFVLDAQIEAWRSRLDITPTLPLYREFEAFHRTERRNTTAEGRPLYTSNGAGYVHLIDRRFILYPAGSAESSKDGFGETVLKEYVNENAGGAATIPPRLLASGATQGLAIQADFGAGTPWKGGRAYRNLLEIAQEVAEATAVDFDVVGTGPATFEFQAQAFPIGQDRSVVGLDPATGLNGANNPPVIFSLAFDNMAQPLYAKNRRQERNAAVVLGRGIEADREVVQRKDDGLIGDSPWNRIEQVRQANQESTMDGLNTVGDALLEESQPVESFSFQPLETEAVVYGRDYSVGDIVTARYQGIEQNLQIKSVTFNVNQGQEDISITVSEIPL